MKGLRWVMLMTLSTYVLLHYFIGKGPIDKIFEYSLPIITHFENAKTFPYAKAQYVAYGTEDIGTWSTNDGHLLWKAALSTKGSSLNLGFSELHLPSSAKLSFQNEQGHVFYQVDAISRKGKKQLWTPIFETQKIILTLQIHSSETSKLRLKIAQINHGFLQEEKRLQEKDCLLDVVCNEENGYELINEYRDVIQSVGLISIGGTGFCTGVLINNTAQDRIPYFLTARHCGISPDNVSSVVVYWNHENSACRSDAMSNSEPGDGSFKVFNEGASIVAEYREADMMLLRLDDPVNADANAFFAGWQREDVIPESTVVIHHALSEEKRISFDFDAPQVTRHFGEIEDFDEEYFRILSYDISSTAEGSSGAPLFDQNKRIVAQLRGGRAECGIEDSDWYGRLFNSWLGDDLPERQLSPWLDPIGSGQLAIDGIWNTPPIVLDLSVETLQEIACAGEANASIQLIANGGTAPYTYSIDGGNIFSNQSVFENLPFGEYQLLVRDAMSNESEVLLHVIEEPEELIVSRNLFFDRLKVRAEGGVPPYQYQLNDGELIEEPCFDNLISGTYMIRVFDANGCVSTSTFDLEIPLFLSEAQVIQDLDCQEAQNGLVEVAVISGGLEPFSYSLDSVEFQSSRFFEALPPGDYVFYVQDALGNRSSTDTISLGSLPNPIEAFVDFFEEFIVVNASGGSGEYTYSIDGVNFQNSNEFVDLPSGTYSIYIMDSNGCILVISEVIITGTKDLVLAAANVYPNPAVDMVTIQFKDSFSGLFEIEVYAISGQRVSLPFTYDGEQRISMDVNALRNGLYAFKVLSEDFSIQYHGTFMVNK